jgi:hypothetical protein
MSEQATASPSSFTGWHRAGSGHRWESLVEASTEAAAWQQLLNRAERGGDVCVLPSGEDPNRGPGAAPAAEVLSVADQQPHYRLTLRPRPSAYTPVIRLRRALKCLLRSFGLECVDVPRGVAPA